LCDGARAEAHFEQVAFAVDERWRPTCPEQMDTGARGPLDGQHLVLFVFEVDPLVAPPAVAAVEAAPRHRFVGY